MSTPDASGAGAPDIRIMTAAQVRYPDTGDGKEELEVVFLESARYYHVRRSNPRFARIMAQVREALNAGRPLSVRLASPGSGVIEDVETT